MALVKKKVVKKKRVVKKKPVEQQPAVMTRDKTKVFYPQLDVTLYSQEHGGNGKLTVEIAKELLGWQEETDNVKFGNVFSLRLPDGTKVRLLNNLDNRPFYAAVADAWKLEILRGKWQLNGETMVIDRLGMIHDGQHRLVGLVLAEVERLANPDKWAKFWEEPCSIETLVVFGISEDDEVVNTLGTGKPRSLSDVIYRSEYFKDLPAKNRAKVARMTSFAVKMVWFRTAADLASFAPKRPHSESLDFIANHPTLLGCVKHIVAEDGDKEKAISEYISIGYAAGLMYLMASAATEHENYDEVGTEEGIDFTLKDKAEEFWVLFAHSEDKQFKLLKETLIKLDATGGLGRDLLCGTICKAWNNWVDGKSITPKAIELQMDEDEFGRPIVVEHPRVGGIDIGEKTA